MHDNVHEKANWWEDQLTRRRGAANKRAEWNRKAGKSGKGKLSSRPSRSSTSILGNIGRPEGPLGYSSAKNAKKLPWFLRLLSLFAANTPWTRNTVDFPGFRVFRHGAAVPACGAPYHESQDCF